MPALITHYLLALRVEKTLAAQGFLLDHAAVCWGAQGPDFLFYHRALPHQPGGSLRRLGSALHRDDPAATFGHMAEFIRRCPPADLTCASSFAYGFLCHLALDSAAHPYVYWFQEQLAKKTGGRPAFMHHKIEHNLDTIMLRRELGQMPSDFSAEAALPENQRMLGTAARMMRYVLAALYPAERISVSNVEQAFKDARLIAGLLTDPMGRKRRLLQSAEKLFHTRAVLSGFICPIQPDGDWDYPNLSHMPWIDRGLGRGKASRDDFFCIFSQAERTAVSLCQRFQQCTELRKQPEFLSAYGFHNGGA